MALYIIGPRSYEYHGPRQWIERFVGVQREINRRRSAIVEYMAFLAEYLDKRPSAADVFSLYYRIERWGA
jgi:hypothetical protein